MNDPDHDVLVLGNGGFGTALSLVLQASGHRVLVWGKDAEYTREIEARRENPKFLPGVRLPPSIRFSSDLGAPPAALTAVVSVVPTRFLAATLESLHDRLPPRALFVSCSKGFDSRTHELPSASIRRAFPEAPLGVLSGPSHAEEVARRLPTTVVAAAADTEVARSIQKLFGAPWFRAYTSTDPLGVEVAGAAKNVMALAAGISDGLGFGDNARAALVCRGALEIMRLGTAMGARPETFSGLSGVGDLVATCTSRHSRNRTVGYRLGIGERLRDILRSTEKVAEGIETTRVVSVLAQRLAVELPITAEVHAVLFEGKDPRHAVEDLMSREAGEELG